METVSIQHIERMIYFIRGQKVMLDSDLAQLYGVETKVLNQAVRRNQARFPIDFMFQLTADEHQSLKSQIVTSKPSRGGKQKRPLVFTENGLAMLSGVLHTERAIAVNISIMRIFTKLRSFLLLEQELRNDTSAVFKVVFERLDSIETNAATLPIKRKKIGLKRHGD